MCCLVDNDRIQLSVGDGYFVYAQALANVLGKDHPLFGVVFLVPVFKAA